MECIGENNKYCKWYFVGVTCSTLQKALVTKMVQWEVFWYLNNSL